MSQTNCLPHQIVYVIGIEGQADGTRARLCKVGGEVLGEGRAASSDLSQGVAQAWDNIQLAIFRAVAASGLLEQAPTPESTQLSTQTSAQNGAEQPPVPLHTSNCIIGLGLAGAENPALRQQFLDANPGHTHLRLESNAYTTLMGAHNGHAGAVVMLGTASMAHAQYGDGRRTSIASTQLSLGAQVSAASLGRRAMLLAQRAIETKQNPSTLVQTILGATGGSASAMLSWCCQAKAPDYANLAPLVFDCANQDPLAAKLIEEAVQTTEQLMLSLDPGKTLPIAILGSLGQRLAERLSSEVRQRIQQAQGDAMHGAMVMCLQP
jgi:glucosamine kinase